MPTITRNTHWFIFSMLILAALGMHIYMLQDVANLSWDETLKDAILNVILLSLGIWGIILVINAYPTRVSIILYGLIVSAFFSLFISTTHWQLMKWFLAKDDTAYITWATHILPVRTLIVWLICTWIGSHAALRKKADSLEAKFQQHTDAAELLREAELFKLRQQLQPHFLYNSLNSISALTMIQPEKAQEMIGKLSDFLRNSVKREAQERLPIEEELQYIEAYLSIESIRFGDRLQIQFEKDYTDDATIPPFLLQPVLENAIKFGLYGKTGCVTITLHITLQQPLLTITISNPYDPETKPPKGTGFGLESIQRRLYLLYSRTDLLEIKKDGQLFTTILKIPQAYVQSDIDRR